MIAVGFVYLLFCGCFVIVNSKSAVDETSGECSNDEYMYVLLLLQTVERICGPTQQLLDRHEQLLKQVSAQLMTIKGGPQSCTTEREVHEKQQFVSALTGQCASINVVVAYSRCSRI